jgi:hypothetical protein
MAKPVILLIDDDEICGTATANDFAFCSLILGRLHFWRSAN